MQTGAASAAGLGGVILIRGGRLQPECGALDPMARTGESRAAVGWCDRVCSKYDDLQCEAVPQRLRIPNWEHGVTAACLHTKYVARCRQPLDPYALRPPADQLTPNPTSLKLTIRKQLYYIPPHALRRQALSPQGSVTHSPPAQPA